MQRYIIKKQLFVLGAFFIIILISSASAVERVKYTPPKERPIIANGLWLINEKPGTAEGGLTPTGRDHTGRQEYRYSPEAKLDGTAAPDRVKVKMDLSILNHGLVLYIITRGIQTTEKL